MSFTTPLPWVAHNDDGNWRVSCQADQSRVVAFVGHDSSPLASGDAHLIEIACNAFDPMVAALAKALHTIESYYDAAISAGFEGPSIFDMAGFELAMRDAKAALMLARNEVTP